MRHVMKIKQYKEKIYKDSLTIYYVCGRDDETNMIFNINERRGKYSRKEWLKFDPIVYYDKEDQQEILDALEKYFGKDYFKKIKK